MTPRPNADLWAANYAETHRGYPYPRGMLTMSKLAVEVSEPNDENDSLLFVMHQPDGDLIYRLWVAACCEERRETWPRFSLEVLDESEVDVPQKLDSQSLLEWYGDLMGSPFDELWQGDHAGQLLEEMADLTRKPAPELRPPHKSRTHVSPGVDYLLTHYGFKYPVEITEDSRVFDASDPADATDSILLVRRNGIFRVWVEPSCREMRSGDRAPRYILEAYPMSARELQQAQRWTARKLEDWFADRGMWREVWRGENSVDLTCQV